MIILITGSSSGIGEKILEEYCARSYDNTVIISIARDSIKLKRIEEKIQTFFINPTRTYSGH